MNLILLTTKLLCRNDQDYTVTVVYFTIPFSSYSGQKECKEDKSQEDLSQQRFLQGSKV